MRATTSEGSGGAGAPSGGGADPPVRLFVAVWPPPDVVAVIEALRRPAIHGVRWTTTRQWHVTLVFLGNVPAARVGETAEALADAVAALPGRPEARLGPATARLGSGVLSVPVGGLDELATAVRGACRTALAADPARRFDDRPFRGHLTLARGSGGRPVPRSLAGASLVARWVVEEVCLVGSELGQDGARYTTLAAARVSG